MKTVAIPVHNSKILELFVEKREVGFEFWTVASMKGQRVILGHHLTHDDVEARLHYAKPADLAWREAEPSEIPVKKHQSAIEDEDSIKQGTFWDYDAPQFAPSRNVANHLGAIVFLSADVDKEEWEIAKQALLGRWTDGVVTMSFEPDHKLGWSCADRAHPLNVGERVNGHPPDWWNFAFWGMALLNSEQKCGTRTGVLRVNQYELHLFSSRPHQIADVFQRISHPLTCSKADQ